MDKSNRIFFKGNPYPEGHRISTFLWSGRIDPDRGLVFDFHLVTEDYDAEDQQPEPEPENQPDWQSKIVWNNYHNCTLSSKAWNNDGIVVASAGNKFDFDHLKPGIFTADPLPLEEDYDPDALAFAIYLLGHDCCAGHQIRIERLSGDTFSIHWMGKIALTYGGDFDMKYDFEAWIAPASFDGIYYPRQWSQQEALEKFSELVADPDRFSFQDLNPESLNREYKLVLSNQETI